MFRATTSSHSGSQTTYGGVRAGGPACSNLVIIANIRPPISDDRKGAGGHIKRRQEKAGRGGETVWIGFQYFNQYLTPLSVSVGIILFIGFLGLAVVLLTEAHET